MNRLIPSTWLRPAPLNSELDRFLHDFFHPAALVNAATSHSDGGPALNIYEHGDAFEIELEVPGLALEEVEVSLEGRELCLRGERKIALNEGGTWQRRERFHGSFERKLRLPVDVDAARVEARLHQGVLTVTCPKAEAAKARKISVQAQAPSNPAS